MEAQEEGTFLTFKSTSQNNIAVWSCSGGAWSGAAN